MSETLQKKPMIFGLPHTHIALVLSCMVLTTIGLMLVPGDPASAKKSQNFPVADLAININDPLPVPAPLTPTTDWQDIKVKSGDNLTAIFKRAGLNARDVYTVMQANKSSKQFTKIKPGQLFQFEINESNSGKTLQQLRFHQSNTSYMEVIRQDNGFSFNHIEKNVEKIKRFAEGSISDSLFLAAQEAGLSDNLTMELANIFGWDIDFVLDIRKGDTFNLIYEELYLEGEKLKDGNILAATFINDGHEYTALRYVDVNGRVAYYTPEGKSMRKAFMRSPVSFARVSSKFNLKRRHPILHKIRAHKGVDYAASRGTPIKATGDGKVIWAGKKGGYGRTVIIQHGQKYSTLYAHLNNYGKRIKNGRRVKQGQVIGYVGSSGMATGAHLHYEFRVNGVHRNPLTVKFPDAAHIDKNKKDHFMTTTSSIKQQLAFYQKDSRMALNDR